MSVSPLLDSDSHRAYDLRTRTITYMLAALGATNRHSNTTLEPNPVLVKEEADLYPAPEGSQDVDNPKQVNPDTLKLLNQLALLLVREHEIIAVLPKRSGSQAHVNIMVSTDSDSDRDEPSIGEPPGIKYFVTRNPRNDSPPAQRSNAGATAVEVLLALEKVTTLQKMYEYLVKYQHVSFPNHVSSVEFLLNRIIAPKLQLQSDRKSLFERFITFRAAPKMHRRFKSLGFASFLQALKSLPAMAIKTSVAFQLQKRKITPNTMTTKNEAHEQLIPSILYYGGFVSPESKCPYLWEQYQNHGSGADVVYAAELAPEFHQVLIYCLEKAAAAVAEFTNMYKTGDLLTHDDNLLTVVEEWMRYVHVIAHESAIFKVHMEALDGDITDLMRKGLPLSNQPPLLRTSTQTALDGNSHNPEANIDAPMQADEDYDGGLSDTAIEIAAAQAVSRAGQQSLWLAVSFQHAILSLCREQVLPKTPLSLTLFNPPVEITPSTQMQSWRSTVASLFPIVERISPANDTEAGIVITKDPPNITTEEVIKILEAYGKEHGGKSTLFLPDRESTIKFRGVYHAESILATMAYLSSYTASPHPCETGDTFHAFRNTYRTIGVSKRCCPICTKLLSLLTPPKRDAPESLEPFTVLCSHPNIYPTSLPPLLPSAVAERLLTWLEELLKQELVKLVKKKRPSTGNSVKSTTSQNSKGESPQKQKDQAMTQTVEARGQVTEPGGVKRFVKW